MPIALVDATGKRLQAVSAAAGRAGVRAGMRSAEARAHCADLQELPWDDVAITASIIEASAQLIGASPQVTPVHGTPGLWWVGASGFDAIGGERALAHVLLHVARRWHPRPRVAIASSCVAARAATWTGASFEKTAGDRALVSVVPAGHDAAYLASAPLALVPMDEELRNALHALGLRTAGAFASLRVEDVEHRWGDTGLRAWRLAGADDARRPVLARVETHPAVDVELATPAATMEPVLFLVRAALDRLVQDLIAHGRAVAAVAITLTLDDARGPMGNGPAHTVTREARTARPLARVVPLFERCRALLDNWTLDAPVIAVRVAIVAAAPLTGEQGDLLSTSWRDPGAADAAFERLRAELGADAIVRAEAQDTHRPERAGVWRELSGHTEGNVHDSLLSVFGKQQQPEALHRSPLTVLGERPQLSPQHRLHGSRFLGPDTPHHRQQPTKGFAVREPPVDDGHYATNGTTHVVHSSPSMTQGLLRMAFVPSMAMARRALDPPESVEVLCHGSTPHVVTWRGQRIPVTRAFGPERLSGDWWDDGYRRDYWRCDSHAGEMVVFFDRANDEWAIQSWGD